MGKFSKRRGQDLGKLQGVGIRTLIPTTSRTVGVGTFVYRSYRWRKLSVKVRASRGSCEKCGSREKLEVDHKVPLYEMGANPENNPLAWDEDNLTVLCRNCHAPKDAQARKTKRMDTLKDSLDWLREEDNGVKN